MNDKDTQSDRCEITDEFVGQGNAASQELRQTTKSPTAGCTIITEQGGAHAGPKRPGAIVSSSSTGCETILTFMNEGFSPLTARTCNGNVAQPNSHGADEAPQESPPAS